MSIIQYRYVVQQLWNGQTDVLFGISKIMLAFVFFKPSSIQSKQVYYSEKWEKYKKNVSPEKALEGRGPDFVKFAFTA